MMVGCRSSCCTIIIAALVLHQKQHCCGAAFSTIRKRYLGLPISRRVGRCLIPTRTACTALLLPNRRLPFVTSTTSSLASAAISSSSSGAEDDDTTPITANTANVMSNYGNPRNHRDQVVSAISGEGGIKVTAVTARNLLNEVMLMHSLSTVAADALGRTIMCSILLSNGIPDEQTLQISIRTTGPLRGVLATCNGLAQVRGYVGTPRLASSLSSSGSAASSSSTTTKDGFSLQDAIGRQSVLQIVKNHPKWKRPYNGYTIARYGDVDRDVGIYLAESEQRSCALAAGLAFDDHQLMCTAAGGYLIEQLPGVTIEETTLVERNLAELVQRNGRDTTLPTNLLVQGNTPLDLIQIILKDLNMKPLQQITPRYQCQCSPERLVRSLRLLPRPEVEDILLKQEQIEARCEFCGKVYRMGPSEVREKLEEDVPSS
jgi:molecular chaperone Hsp33